MTGNAAEKKRLRVEVDLIALNARLKAADQLAEALVEAVPYINNVAADPANSPWRTETAEGVMARLRFALAEWEATKPEVPS